MSIPISYLILSFPIAVIIIQGWVIRNMTSASENVSSAYSIAYCIGKILMYINTSTNIFFYIFLGKGLRKDFVAILPCRVCLARKRPSGQNNRLKQLLVYD